MVFKMRKSNLILISLIFALMLVVQPAPVKAHAPGSMTLEYDFDSQELTVSVSHSVSDVFTHYIYEIVIVKNSVVFTTEEYTNQSSTSGMSDDFDVPAVEGDVLQVTAKCSIAGQISNQITVTESGTTPTTTDTPIPTILLVTVVVLVLGFVFVVFALMKRR